MWEFLSKNNLGEKWLEKLIEKNLTRKEQVDELEKVWEFLSKNNLGDLFEKLVDKGVTTFDALNTIDNENVGLLKLEPFESIRLLRVLNKVNIFPFILSFFSIHTMNPKGQRGGHKFFHQGGNFSPKKVNFETIPKNFFSLKKL